MSEVIEHPSNAEALSQRWRDILGDPRLTDFVGKIDLDNWGRIIMSPVNTEHGAIGTNLEMRGPPFGVSGDRFARLVDLTGVIPVRTATKALRSQSHG